MLIQHPEHRRRRRSGPGERSARERRACGQPAGLPAPQHRRRPHLTRDPELRSTHSGKSVATISVASDRRDRQAPALFVDLVVWERQAEAAAEHLVKGQAVSFSGRFEPREYATSSGDKRLALEIHDVAIEYGPKPRAAEPDTGAAETASSEASDEEDIPF
jgi:single stranded DNA-binding protein